VRVVIYKDYEEMYGQQNIRFKEHIGEENKESVIFIGPCIILIVE